MNLGDGLYYVTNTGKPKESKKETVSNIYDEFPPGYIMDGSKRPWTFFETFMFILMLIIVVPVVAGFFWLLWIIWPWLVAIALACIAGFVGLVAYAWST